MKMCTKCKKRPGVWKVKNTKKAKAQLAEDLHYMCDGCLNEQAKPSEILDLVDLAVQVPEKEEEAAEVEE